MPRLITILTQFRRVPDKRRLGAALGACGLAGLLAITAYAQSRSVTVGVYSSAQAARGLEIYRSQCAVCHGDAMEGASAGPPLAGESFKANWSGGPLTDVVDKIQKSMPFDSPRTLSRQQSVHLAASMLQAGKFSAGQSELNTDALAQIVMPTVQSSTAAVAGGGLLSPPQGNLAELMIAIAFPNSNIVFNVQVKDPGQDTKKEIAAVPFDYVVWGSSVYPGWMAIDQAAIAITETAPLFLTPGRRCQNGKPVPVDRDDWKKFTTDLIEVSKLARREAQARNAEAFISVAEKLNDACANCHKVYRDRGGTEGSGASRCE